MSLKSLGQLGAGLKYYWIWNNNFNFSLSLLSNEDGLKNEDEYKKEGDPKNEEDPKNENEPQKKKTTFKMKMTLIMKMTVGCYFFIVKLYFLKVVTNSCAILSLDVFFCASISQNVL